MTKLDRRRFLRLSALSAGSLLLAACGGSPASTPTSGPTSSPSSPPSSSPSASPAASPTAVATASADLTPQAASTPVQNIGQATPESYAGEYHEAPMLAELVKAGKLPPVEQRLPKHPYVVPHKWVQQGKYGGKLMMACTDQGDWATGHLIQESMYGHSPLRWLRDGLQIGPGLVEAWEANEDQTVWTFHLREGLRWSDGEPYTTADILFWWEDEVLNPEHPEAVPFELVSATGNPAKLKAIDDVTLQITFDAPAPLLPGLMACWVKRGIGPRWMDPKHYLKQFHPKYNSKVGKNWVDTFNAKADFATNPECPTMTGWRLKEYKRGQYTIWERNPYYWCIDRWGNQLPYIDTIQHNNVQDAEVLKLKFTQGAVDYVHGGFVPINVEDIATFKQAQPRSKLQIELWDSGSGTASVFFFNYDYIDPEMRQLIRNPKFRQALSYAYNRSNVQKLVYLQTGEITTGTTSPKSIEFVFNDQGRKVYEQWRDSYATYDPEKAKQMLDELGVKDVNGDGWRELPNGGKLLITLDYPASEPQSSEHVRKNELLAKDWQAIGLNARPNPQPPTGYDDRWNAGKILSKTAWEVSDGPNSLVNPTWLIPLETSRWAPLHGQGYILKSTDPQKIQQQKNRDPWKRQPPHVLPEPGDPIDRLYKAYDKARRETDPIKQHKLVWDIVKIHVEDGPFFMGCVANYPRIVLYKEGLMNVPKREDLALHGFVNTWIHPTPAVYDPEAYYWDNPQEHM